MNPGGSKYSIWAATCIGVGLAIAYIDGISVKSLVGSALIMSSLICATIAIAWLLNRLRRKRRLGCDD